ILTSVGVIRLAIAEIGEHCLKPVSNRISRGAGELNCLFRERDSLIETPYLGVSRRDSRQSQRVLIARQFAHTSCQLHSLSAVSESQIGIGCERPGEVINRLGLIWI